MSNQNLIIYNFNSLYKILEELSLDLNFNIIHVNNENSLNEKIQKINNYLIIAKKNSLNINNQIILDILPINISKLIEKINIQFLKIQFNSQSQVKINKYIIDLNSREMIFDGTKVKLTEKETNTITYLSKVKKPVSVNELEEIAKNPIKDHTIIIDDVPEYFKGADKFRLEKELLSINPNYKLQYYKSINRTDDYVLAAYIE